MYVVCENGMPTLLRQATKTLVGECVASFEVSEPETRMLDTSLVSMQHHAGVTSVEATWTRPHRTNVAAHKAA